MAWFRNRLYVGTTRANLHLIKNSVNLNMDRWPVEIKHRVYSRQFEYEAARAQIWRYTPEADLWERIYQAPIVVGNHGEEMSRDLGYRGIIVYKAPSDKHECLYLTNWSRSHGDGPCILRSEDGATFQTIPKAIKTEHPVNSVRSLVAFKGRLFTAPTGGGKGNPNTSMVPSIYCTEDPNEGQWKLANIPGFGDKSNLTIFEMKAFGDWLYAGTANNKGFQLWRSRVEGEPPFDWELVIRDGAGRGSLNQIVGSLCVFKGDLYVGSAIQNGGYDHTNDIGPAGAEIIRVSDDGSWRVMVGDTRDSEHGLIRPRSGLPGGFGNLFSGYIWRMAVHDGWLYAGTMEWSVTMDYAEMEGRPHKVKTVMTSVGQANIVSAQSGFDFWRTSDGENWVAVDRRGMENPYNYGLRTLASTPHGLFIGTANPFGPRVLTRTADGEWGYKDNPRGGCEIWLGNRSHPSRSF
jgi:hypothetical protein